MSECGTTDRHYESYVVGWFWKHPFLDDSESKKGRNRHFGRVSIESGTNQSRDRTGNRFSILTRRSKIDEDLLKLFRKVEINIPLLEEIKQVPKYAMILKDLRVHKRKKIKGATEMGGIMLTLVKHEDASVGLQKILPKKCQDLGIFAVPCTIDNRTFTDAMLDLGASINVMPASIYKSLNLRDLEPTRIEIQLANRSVVQPLDVLEDVLIQVNKLILPADFYMLDMEDEPSREGSTLILG
ncbi:hypothetical protein CR513_00525, partial [Mucuna pruriens]